MIRTLSALSLVLALTPPAVAGPLSWMQDTARQNLDELARVRRATSGLCPGSSPECGEWQTKPAPEASTTTTDTRINAPTSKQKTITTNTDSRSVTTVGPTTTKIGPSATTGASTASNGPIQVNPTINFNPTITIQNQGSAESFSGGRVVPVAPPVAVPPRPVCRPGVIGNVGVDPAGLGRPVYINLRIAPNAAAPVAASPDGQAVIMAPGTRIAICGGAGNWAQVDVCQPPLFPGQPPACARGFVFNRYVLPL